MRHPVSSPPAASVARGRVLRTRLSAVALLPCLLCAAGAPPAALAGRLPEWLLGDWTAVEVRQNDAVYYIEGSSPQHWYGGRVMTVTPDRLTFVRDACEVGSVRARQGPISAPMRDIAGGGLDAFGLPPEPKPVNYIAIQCARSLLDMGDGRGTVQDRGIKFTWYVVVRSPVEIDMPFLGGAYIKFRRVGPTS